MARAWLDELLSLLREIRDLLQKPGPVRGYGPCDLLTVRQAARVLRMSDADAKVFLERRGLIHYYDGRPRVIAGELVAAHDEARRARAAGVRRRRAGDLSSWDALKVKA